MTTPQKKASSWFTRKNATKKAKPPLPKVSKVPKKTEIHITRKCPNKTWVLGELIDGTSHKVLVPKWLSPKLLHKTIPVVRVDEAGESYYKYLP